MGNEASLLQGEAINFDAEEIRRLGKRFRKLDLDNSGTLSVEEFMSLPELQGCCSQCRTGNWGTKQQGPDSIGV